MSQGQGPGPVPLKTGQGAAWVCGLGGWLLHPVMWDQVVWFLSPTLLICAEGVLSGERAGLPGTLAGTRGARKRHHWWEVPSPGRPGGPQSRREAFPVSGAPPASE